MQRSESVTTMPSSRLYRAPTGQTFTHGASSQCMHGRGMNQTLVPGNSPSSKRNTYIQKEASVVLFSTLQASMHARQPVHLSRSTTIPYLGIFVTSSYAGSTFTLTWNDWSAVLATYPSPVKNKAFGVGPRSFDH